MKKLTKIVIFCICLSLSIKVFAKQDVWQVSYESDAMTDKVTGYARTINAKGYKLMFYRDADNKVWLNFSLPPSSSNQISYKRAPMIRVDKHTAYDIDPIHKVLDDKSYYQWEPRWFNLYIWAGVEEDGRSKIFENIMSGNSILIRYYLTTGGYEETSFSLNGAAEKIAAALKINANPDSTTIEKVTKLRNYNIALDEQKAECNRTKEVFGIKNCDVQINECNKKSNRDINVLNNCMLDYRKQREILEGCINNAVNEDFDTCRVRATQLSN